MRVPGRLVEVRIDAHEAVELVERFSVLAGSEVDEATDVRAYLTAPTLVGRVTHLVAVRRRTLRALRLPEFDACITSPNNAIRSAERLKRSE